MRCFHRLLLRSAAILLLGSIGPGSMRAAENAIRIARWEPRDFAFSAKLLSVENPFAVRFTATVKAPDGRTFTQPGFFDGGGTWKVRVSGTQAGTWSLVTHSEVAELDGRQASFTCTADL